ncbi:LuxR C-terminal-related transcriptional regulator [Streptomyces sp. Tu 3180]|uniref:LuxR C-terminal-related transcriptional regulator n=1 Tax=Streptomyces sp. Tu 3180 TaxID=2682611 RepID=UPI00135B5236|nr:LuxR C-terminal-related transcriptional regulator [Streptomyces sp. Tu 3180]KAF3468176.1 helix-turn-helix transcriptional regulator [Streptomyces sp. Tu 3180]
MSGLEGDDPPSAEPVADPHGDPYLRTRFTVPARPVTFLRRERLTRHLDRALRTPLTMVNGAAGAGKTLLAADWAESRDGLPVAWLTTDAAGEGAGMFWAYLLQALRTAGVALPADIGFPADAHRVSPALPSRLAAGLSARERPVIVILDEFDRVTAPEIAEQLDFVLRHAGTGLRLVLVTRTEPLLPLHRYRAAGELTEIRGAELAFTPRETAGLMALHGLRLPAGAVRALVARTRGWAAGLRLCALAAGESRDPQAYLEEFEADRSTIADFLLAEVLKRQDPGTQDLLLRVSLLDRFCPGLANALTGRNDAGAILDRLSRDNAFVEHLEHGLYRLHPLFREILHAHLRMRQPDAEPELHRRAAAWLQRSGHLTEALGHGAAGGDWGFTAGALIDDLAVGQFFTGPRSDAVTGLFSGMRRETTGTAPELVRAARELARRDLGAGLAHLRRARQGLAEYGGTAGDAVGPAAARLSCALLEALAARLAGAPDRAESAARVAERMLELVPADLLERHPELTALLLDHVGSARLWAGRFDQARAALSTVADSAAQAATALPHEDSLGRLALIDHLDGWLGGAERRARAALTETERFGLSRPSGSGVERLVLAAVAVDRDELGQAQALLDASAESHPALRDPVLEAGRALTAARLHLARGDPRAALKAVEPEVPADAVSPWVQGQTALVAAAAHLAEGRVQTAAGLLRQVPEEQVACAVGAARLQLAAGRPAAAVSLLDRAHPEGRSGPAVTVRAALVRAEAADAAGDAATARGLVARALLEARRERLRRPFREAGPWIRPYLDTASRQGAATGWLAPDGGHPGGPPRHEQGPPPPLVEELSGRERDVLRRLALTMSTEEIAADLYVSVNTVKTHLKGVYRKLSVNRRNEAVRRARELDLL